MISLNVLVYSGPGIGPNAYSYLLRTLRQFFSHRYAIIPVEPETLHKEPWESKAALLVIPGGRDIPYSEAMNGEINQRIKNWVEGGGKYLGLCAGGYYGSGKCVFEPSTPMEVIGDRELAFFKGTCLGCAYPGYNYKTEDGARAAEISVNKRAFGSKILPLWEKDPSHIRNYYNGGGFFLTDNCDENITVLANYSDVLTDPRDRTKNMEGEQAAIISCKVGKGIAVLSGVHPEYAWDFLAPSNYTQPYNRQLIALLRRDDAYRRRLLGAMFAHMKLDVDPDALGDKIATEYSLRIPTVTPTFLVPARVSGVAAAASTMYAFSTAAVSTNANIAGIQDKILSDADDIHIVTSSSTKGRRKVPVGYQKAVLIPEERDLPPEHCLNHNGSDAAPSKRQTMLVLCMQDSLPDTKETPRFDMELAIKYMQEVKAHTVGSWLMYSDTTNSTQTFLERNMKLQALLPNGTVNVATVQLSARGRGRNAWVAPVGCLQFTLLLRHPKLPQAPVVMLQYLISLAVVEAIKAQPGYEGLPLRLKWPNDLYAKFDSTKDSDDSNSDSSNDMEFVKIGGVLVGSSFKSGEFTLLLGCGINVSNPLPTTSINKVIHQYNLNNGTNLATISLEKALALMTAKFEELYRQFLVNGFEPFLKLYYKNWLHSDQIVTLVDQDYQRAKVIGLCPKDGLLQVRSLANPQTVYNMQPDGNSFDMLHGLISRKTT